MKKIVLSFAAVLWVLIQSPPSAWGIDYQLFKNFENFGIVMFPKGSVFPELRKYVNSLGFEAVESGRAVMRYGSRRENQTYMMPPAVQKKYSMEKFIVIQILSPDRLMVGIYDPEWGLTLPSAIFQMSDLKRNIPKTLDRFRGSKPKKEIRRRPTRSPNLLQMV